MTEYTVKEIGHQWIVYADRLSIAACADEASALSRTFELLTAEIEFEENRAGVRDLSDPAYPVLARSLRVRRENIGATIASLEALGQGTPKAA
jgi:hypothetical protein